MDANVDDILETLWDIGFQEPAQIHEFKGRWKIGTPDETPVTIRIIDSGGKRQPQARYDVEAIAEGRKPAYGNSSSSVLVALKNVHWDDLNTRED